MIIKVLDGQVKITTDLSIFKKLNGNREVSEARVAKIENSVRKIGWIIPVIIVNEKMEVIDGQGRLEVARRNNLPIAYKVVPGIGVQECIAMNIDQMNWTLDDYCRSYESQGYEDYKRFNRVRDAFPEYAFTVVSSVVTGNASTNEPSIKEGKLVCTKEQEDFAKEILAWLGNFRESLNAISSGKTVMYKALIFVYTSVDECDKDRLVSTMTRYDYSARNSFGKVTDALIFIEDRYNARLGWANKIWFEKKYREAQATNNSWYDAKWGYRYNDDDRSGKKKR